MNKATYYFKSLTAPIIVGLALGTGVGDTAGFIYTEVSHYNTIHDVSDPQDRAYADRVREAAPLQDWVTDSVIIKQSKFSCAIYNKVPEMTMDKHFELHRHIMFGADQAFQYMSYEGVKRNCPQYLDKYPVDFNYKVVKEYKTETQEG